MSEVIVYSGETLSFYQLFIEKQLRIEIPIIQRDYAQGRKSQHEVRTNFLNALFIYLDENKPNRDLDFVYGSTENDAFIPLDGQQRLTTLFLLHWYLAQLSDKMDSFRSVLAKDGYSLFSYKTRPSSKEFCNALMCEDFSYLGSDVTEIANKITNEGWFYRSWKLDPTVSAMLEMLSAIEKKFSDRPEFFDRLIDTANPVITFQFLDLDEFHLTDDLYIKMNSRGKPLSPFENFKAKLEQSITELFVDDPLKFEIELTGESHQRSPAEYFSLQIDTNWLNHFWKVSEHDPEMVDEYLMNLIRVVLANNAAVIVEDLPIESKRILFKTQDAYYEHHNRDALSFYSLEELGAITKETILQLIHSFDRSVQVLAWRPYTPDVFYYNAWSVFKDVVKHNLSAQDRVLFHAFMLYLINHKENLEALNEWMRVVFNLIENTRTESADEITTRLKEINMMIPHAPTVLEFLVDADSQISGFYGKQIEEERIKAHLILKSTEWTEIIKFTEKHPYFRGQVGFLLEFSGVLEYYSANSNCAWSEGENKDFIAAFIDYAKKATCVFDKLIERDNKDYMWERTVLTKGDYLIPSSYHRYHFLTTSLTDRDNSWKRLLRLNRMEDEYLDPRRLMVKKVFDDERFDPTGFEGSCRAIIQDGADDWRSFFIKKPELIRQCARGFMRFEDELTIYLLETTRLTYHRELRTYSLYLEHIEDRDFAPFENTHYVPEYGYEGHSHILIGTWTYERKEYQLKVYFNKLYHYGVEFSKVRGANKEDDYADQIQSICNELNFQFDIQDWNGYFKTTEIETEIIKAIINLTEKLRQLS